jgi:hypothetical protein
MSVYCKYDDSGTGTGKTFAQLENIADINQGNWLFCLSMKDAVREKIEEFRKFQPDYDVHEIVSTFGTKVGEKIYQRITEANKSGRPTVLFVTHTALGMIAPSRFAGWNLVIDEDPNFITASSFVLEEKFYDVRSLFNFTKEGDRHRISLSKKGHDLYRDHLSKSRYQRDALTTAIEVLLDLTYQSTCYINEGWINGDTATAVIVKEIHPSNFAQLASFKILSADFEQSITYQVWSQLGVEFVKEVNATRLQLPQNKIEIFHFSDRNASISHFQNARPLDKVQEWVGKNIKSPTIVASNKKVDFAPVNSNLIEVSMTSNGMNKFSHIHDALWLGSVKQSNPIYEMYLQTYGLDKKTLIQIMEYGAMYQFVTRTSIRENNGATNRFYVFDRNQAEYLGKKFGVEPQWIDIGLPEAGPRTGRPKGKNEPITSAQCMYAKRLKDKGKIVECVQYYASIGHPDKAQKLMDKPRYG